MTNFSTCSETVRQVVSQFEAFEKTLSRNGQSWFLPVRRTALRQLETQGFPTRKQEAWKHTDLRPLFEREFVPTGGEETADAEVSPLAEDLRNWKTDRLVFIDGKFSERHSTVGDLPGGMKILNLKQALSAERPVVEPHLGKTASPESHSFVALNTAFLEDGAFVYLPDGTVADRPVHLLFVTTEEAAGRRTHPRVLIVTGRDCRLSVVESYETTGSGVPYFTNAVTEIVVGEQTTLSYHRLQQEDREAFHVSTIVTNQSRNSRFDGTFLSTGASLARCDIAAVLAEEGCDCTLTGLFLTEGRQHTDHHTILDHAAAHCHSEELFKGILEGESMGAFTGRIIVRPGAQKTDAVQSSKNLLLSDRAAIHPDPQLEIYADDVKCTHGATVGQIDEEAVYYLRSRGLTREEARGLLTYAFANEIVERIEILPVRERLEKSISERYRTRAFAER